VKKYPDCVMDLIIRTLILGVTVSSAQAGETALGSKQLSVGQLEKRLAEIDQQLNHLCPISLRSGVGAVGSRSAVGEEETRSEWFQIDLSEPASIDRVVLVPTIWRDTKTGFRADGFPLDFRVVVGAAGDSGATVVASYTANDGLLPRVAPLVVPFPSTVASWVRIEASRLSPRLWDSRYVLQLSEVMIFSGRENIALHQNVRASSGQGIPGDSRNKQFLVDGFIPYLMDASEGEKSIAFVRQSESLAQPKFSIDLGLAQPLSSIHLHAVDLSDTVPQAYADGYGMPRHLLLEGANRSDYSDAVRLLEFESSEISDFGPIIMRRFPETRCQYVRLTALDPDVAIDNHARVPRIGFAEIELFAKGKNVARGVPFRATPMDANPNRPLRAITDGRNFYGKILPVRDWMNDLALRHDLETERPLVIAELNRRYSRQSSLLSLMTWLAALAVIGIGVTILIDRIIRMRQMANMKERFAADLHDELGANLHVIGLLGDLAQAAVDSPEKLKGLHQRIRVMTERSGTAVQNCTNILEAKELYQDLYQDMQRTTQRIMADLDGSLTLQGSEEHLQRLKLRTRADLFLFYKECLVNISRHSGATQFSALLEIDTAALSLTVSDNGQGLDDASKNNVPPSLLRRARLLGANVTATSLESGGTHIALNLLTRRFGRRR
jgi:signal transduction histidine kinase